MTTKKLCPRGTKIQSLIFSKDKFNTKSAKSWAEKHKFKFGKVDETTNNLRIRQHSPTNFLKTSFRTIGITNGIKAVIGCPVKKMESGGFLELLDSKVINDSCVVETIGVINDYSPLEWWFIDDYNYNLVIYFEESFTANDIDNIQDILNQFELCHDIITPEINLQYDKEGKIIYIPLLTNEFTVGKYEDGGKVNLYADLTNDEVLRNYNKLMYEYQKISSRDENWAKDKKDIYLKLIANYKLALEMRGVMSDGGNIESQYSIENILNISGVPEKDREKLINDFRASGYGDTYELIGDFPNELPLEQKVWVTATNIEEKVNDFKDGENTFLEATLIAEAIHSIYENEEIVSEETEEEETKEEIEQAPEKTEDDNATQSHEIDDSEVTELVENVYAEFLKLKNDEIFVAFLNELKNQEIFGQPYKYHIEKFRGNGGVQIYVFNPLTLKFTDVPAYKMANGKYANKRFLNIPDKELVTFEEYAEGNWKDFNDNIILNNIKSLLKQFKEDKNYIGVEKTASYYLLPEHKQEFIDFAISQGYTNIAYYDGKYFEAGGEVLIGGKADNMSLDDIADMHGVPLEQILRQSRIGLKVEREHTSDMNKVIEIVKDHLYESPLYYTKLQKIESSFETGGTIGDLYLDVPSENNDMFKLYATSEIRGFSFKSGIENNGSFRYVFTSERDLDKAIGILLRLQNGRGNMPTNLNQLKKMLQVGSLLKLTYNRVRPDRVGKIFVVAKVQSNGIWLIEGVTVPNDVDFKKAIWLEYPKTDEILFNVLGFSIYGKNILNKGTINWTSEYVKMLSYEYILGEQIDIAKATYTPTEQIDDTYVKNQAYLRTVYVNELINLIDDIQTYKMGGGVKPEYFNLNKKIDKDKLLTVSCFIKSKDTNKSLYVRRAEGDHIGYWSLVSGTVEKGEFPEDAIKREIQEELQVKLDFSNLIYVAQTPSPYGVHYYYELTVNEEFEPNLNEENDKFAWLHYGKMPKQTHPLLIKFMKSNVMA
jgi:ADP-ribose pyrophosphatase YjhB (NUDIX family)